MSLYILQIAGISRYDVPNCNVTNKMVTNWSQLKQKLRLTDLDCREIYKIIKRDYKIVTTEVNGHLQFDKQIQQNDFNDVLRDYVKTHKICTTCRMPEITDGKCAGCGYLCSSNVTLPRNLCSSNVTLTGNLCSSNVTLPGYDSTCTRKVIKIDEVVMVTPTVLKTDKTHNLTTAEKSALKQLNKQKKQQKLSESESDADSE